MLKISFSDAIGIAGIAFAIILFVLDKAGKLKGNWLLGLLCLAGAMTLFIALGNSWVVEAPHKWQLWRRALMFLFVAFVYSGIAIWISEGRLPAPSQEGGTTHKNQLPHQIIGQVAANHLRKKSLPSAKEPAPRLGTGPDAYKELSDLQVAQWAAEEAGKIEEMAGEHTDIGTGNKALKDARAWFFSMKFKKCCAQDVKDLRAEILRRLGPPGKDADEMDAWTQLFPDSELPGVPEWARTIYPATAVRYAPYLRRLGLRLKRRTVPRPAPLALQFSEQKLPPEKPGYSRIDVRIETKKELSAGYIAVEFSGQVYSAGCDFKDSRLAVMFRDFVENPVVAELLKAPTANYVLQIGKTPFVPGKAIRVELRASSVVRVSSVMYFEE